jgi:plastocyanin
MASTADGGSGSTSSAASPVRMTIKGFAFQVPDAVAAGATVMVVNNDKEPHTVTSTRDGGFNVTVPGGATASFTAPAAAGRYDFVCNFHGNMKGTLVVG